MKRRIVITVCLVTVLIAEDVLAGEQPHSILNLRDPWSGACVALVALGVCLRSWAAGVLHKNRTLATAGPYALTRNPLYLGSFLMMQGFCILIGDLDNCLIMALLGIVVYGPTIRREERRMFAEFGEHWTRYARHTPRLLPWRLPLRQLSDRAWSFKQWLRNREYKAVVGASLGCLAFQIWFEFARG